MVVVVLGLRWCLTSIITHMGHVLQACFTLVLTSEPLCCSGIPVTAPPTHTFPAHLRPFPPSVIVLNAGVPHSPWGCDAIFLSSIPVLFKSELARVPWGFPGGSVVKKPACQCRKPGFDPWVRKIPWRRKWQPTPVFLPGKSHGQRSLVG